MLTAPTAVNHAGDGEVRAMTLETCCSSGKTQDSGLRTLPFSPSRARHMTLRCTVQLLSLLFTSYLRPEGQATTFQMSAILCKKVPGKMIKGGEGGGGG